MDNFRSGKVYDHNHGFTCSWINQETGLVNGGSIRIELEFVAQHLDERNFVIDFGCLKSFKKRLEYMFDHTFLLSRDESNFEIYLNAHNAGLLQLRELSKEYYSHVGSFAYIICYMLHEWLDDSGHKPRVDVFRVSVYNQDSKCPISEYLNDKYNHLTLNSPTLY